MFDQVLGQTSLATLMLFALSALIFLLLWFVVNRASVKANLQVRLLAEIAEQQRRQTELLEQLVNAQVKDSPGYRDDDPALNFSKFVPER